MDKCDNCQIEYPVGYCSIFTGFSPKLGGMFIKFVCGICALEISNELHSTNITMFEGYSAEKMRQKAIEYRKKINAEPKST